MQRRDIATQENQEYEHFKISIIPLKQRRGLVSAVMARFYTDVERDFGLADKKVKPEAGMRPVTATIAR